MNEINVGRFSGILHKLLDMKEGSPAPTLAPEVVPVLGLSVDRPEWGFLANERLCGLFETATGSVGNVSHVALLNPANSGALIVVKAIINISAGGNDYRLIGMNTGTPTFDASNAGLFLDSRYGSTARSIGVVGTRVQAAGFTYDFAYTLTNTYLHEFTHPIILKENSYVYVRSAATNKDFDGVSFIWTERVLEASETR